MKRWLPLLLLTACSTAGTVVTDVYKDPAATRMQFQRVAAIAIADDPAVRRAAEDEMVAKLGAKGVASYTILTAEDERTPDAVRAKLQSLGFDGAVTMRLLSAGDEQIDATGGMPDSYKAFTGYYGGTRSGAAAWEQVARVETEIFSVTSNRLLWSAATKTFEPSNARAMVADVAKAVAAELRKDNLLQ